MTRDDLDSSPHLTTKRLWSTEPGPEPRLNVGATPALLVAPQMEETEKGRVGPRERDLLVNRRGMVPRTATGKVTNPRRFIPGRTMRPNNLIKKRLGQRIEGVEG